MLELKKRKKAEWEDKVFISPFMEGLLFAEQLTNQHAKSLGEGEVYRPGFIGST